MQPTTVVCLALLCLAVFISTGSALPQDDSALIDDSLGLDIEAHDTLDAQKDNLPQTRGRCRVMGRCVHDAVCNGHCQALRYKDGSCSGSSCICCA